MLLLRVSLKEGNRDIQCVTAAEWILSAFMFCIIYGRGYPGIFRVPRVEIFETTRNVTISKVIFKYLADNKSWTRVWPTTQEKDFLLWGRFHVDRNRFQDPAALST